MFKYLEINLDEYFSLVDTLKVKGKMTTYTLSDLLAYGEESALNEPEKDITQPVFGLFATFGLKMANFLNIDRDTKYFIHSDDLDDDTPAKKYRINVVKYNPLLTPRFISPKILSYFIYSDIIKQSVRFGDTVSNLLAIITADSSVVNIRNPIVTFKPLSHNSIYIVNIFVTDQFGAHLHFIKGQYAAIELIVRKRR